MSTEYTYAAAYVKSLEAKMLTDSDFLKMLDYNISELAEFLRGRDYSGENLWEMLENERSKDWQLCFDLCDGDDMLDVLMSENDFHNIKAVIKAVLSGNNWHELVFEPSGIDCQSLEAAVKNNSFQSIDERYSQICLEAFELYKNRGGQAMEIYLDKSRYERLLLESEKNSFVYGWAQRKVAVANLKIFFAGSDVPGLIENALIKGSMIDTDSLAVGKASKETVLTDMGYLKEYQLYEKSPTRLEKYFDDSVMEYLKNAQTEFFEFAPILGYFEGKKTELVNIRLIAYGRKSGMEKEKIAERLRKAYV